MKLLFPTYDNLPRTFLMGCHYAQIFPVKVRPRNKGDKFSATFNVTVTAKQIGIIRAWMIEHYTGDKISIAIQIKITR